MVDGARISVRAGTRLALDTYKLDGARASAIATSGAEGEDFICGDTSGVVVDPAFPGRRDPFFDDCADIKTGSATGSDDEDDGCLHEFSHKVVLPARSH